MADEPTPSPAPSPPGADAAGAPRPANDLVRVGLIFYGIVTLFAFGYALFDRMGGDGSTEPFLGLGLPSIGLALGGIGVGLVVVALVHVGRRALNAVEIGAKALARVIGPISKKEAVYLAAMSAVGEELLFRGALWEHLGLLGTTFLFGLVHIIPRRNLWGYPLFALVAGLLLGLLRESSGSVFPAILAHFVINALNLAWLGANYERLVYGEAAMKSDGSRT